MILYITTYIDNRNNKTNVTISRSDGSISDRVVVENILQEIEQNRVPSKYRTVNGVDTISIVKFGSNHLTDEVLKNGKVIF